MKCTKYKDTKEKIKIKKQKTKCKMQKIKKAPSGYERARGNLTQPLIFQIKLPELAP